MPMTDIPPNRMSAIERLDEVASILAIGIARFVAKKRASSQADNSGKETVFASTSPPAGASMDRTLNQENGHD